MEKRFKSVNFFETQAKSVTTIAGSTVIKDVVIVQAGVDKVGDYMDNGFIDALVAQGNEAPTGIKCRGGHPNMCKDSLGTYIGDFHNFRATEQNGTYKAVADLYIAEIAKKTQIDGHGISYHDYVVEMAKNSPDKLGNSIVFRADEEPFEIEPGKSVPKLTLTQFIASDIVDSPAATDGLFKSDEDLGVKLTEFLDDNPEVLDAISKNENSIEIFFKKYANHSQINKSKIMGILDKVKSKLGLTAQKNLDVTDATGQIITVVTDGNEPQAGDEVQIGGAAAPDGEYTFPDGSKWKVVGGKIESITSAAPADTQPADPTPPADPAAMKAVQEMEIKFKSEMESFFKKQDEKMTAFQKEVSESIDLILENMKSEFVPPVPGQEGEPKNPTKGKSVSEVIGKQ